MNTTATLEQLKSLRLLGMLQAYQSILDMPIQDRPDGHEMISLLAQREQLYQTNKRSEMNLKMSGLRYKPSIENVKLGIERNFTKDQLYPFMDLDFIKKAENVIITGATGSGKSFLACAIGHRTCILGTKVQYYNVNRLIEKITLVLLDGTFIKFLNYLKRFPLLIFDDFGLQPLSKEVKLALLQILEDRYNKYPTIFVSQLPVSSWHQFLDDPTLADAILDRLTARAHRIDLKGDSLRHLS